ncbi:hypothetical protein V8G54_007073 [Vigna mungo]|uniref:Uncharacterized protein n=1 Tax=Vigna mungo TaxID=3915 RepID=A0AAQ3P098_VIGMU
MHDPMHSTLGRHQSYTFCMYKQPCCTVPPQPICHEDGQMTLHQLCHQEKQQSLIPKGFAAALHAPARYLPVTKFQKAHLWIDYPHWSYQHQMMCHRYLYFFPNYLAIHYHLQAFLAMIWHKVDPGQMFLWHDTLDQLFP